MVSAEPALPIESPCSAVSPCLLAEKNSAPAFVTARFDKASKLWFVSQENFARHMIENLNIRVTYIADDADEEEDDD